MGKFRVDYKAGNCTYIINRIEGTPARPKKNLQADIRQLGEFEYETVVYTGALLGKNYFGKGACHWQPEGFGSSLKVTGGAEKAEFNFSETIKYLLDKKILTRYYWEDDYPYFKDIYGSNPNIKNTVSSGGDALTDFSAGRQQDLSTVTVTLEEL